MKEERISGLETSDMDLEGAIREPIHAVFTSNFNISWLGTVGVNNVATVEQTNYDGKRLSIQVVVTGTPTWGTACVITVTPVNCELKSGAQNVKIEILGGNLGVTFLSDITPKESYKGKNVQYTVSIVGAPDGVFYARGAIGG